MTSVLLSEATARDFDFLIGSWNVRNRRLRRRLVESEEWEEFDATVVARRLLNGLGNEDEFRTAYDGGFVGMSFRFFDPERRRWSIYWADTRRPGVLDPPVFGGFSGDVGIFEGDDTHEGTPVRVRFTWSGVTGPTPRWEQAFSADGGSTWETNWAMDFTRAEADT
jgi:hypothetical protein